VLKNVSNSSELLATSVQFVTYDTPGVIKSARARAATVLYTSVHGSGQPVGWVEIFRRLVVGGSWVSVGRLQKIKLFVIYLDSKVLVKLLAEY